MHKRRIPLVIGLTLILVTITGVWARGVPILPREHDLSDQVRTLAHLAKMRMDITLTPHPPGHLETAARNQISCQLQRPSKLSQSCGAYVLGTRSCTNNLKELG